MADQKKNIGKHEKLLEVAGKEVEPLEAHELPIRQCFALALSSFAIAITIFLICVNWGK
jgi:hypothetical protein